MEKEQEVMVETAEAAAPVENTAKRKSNASVPVDQFDWDSFEEDSSEADRLKKTHLRPTAGPMRKSTIRLFLK